MKITKAIGSNIFVDPKVVNFDDIDKFLGRYGLKIHWLFEDGVQFEYPEEFGVRYDPGDVSFTAANDSRDIILTVIDDFGSLEFIDKSGNLVYEIKTID